MLKSNLDPARQALLCAFATGGQKRGQIQNQVRSNLGLTRKEISNLVDHLLRTGLLVDVNGLIYHAKAPRPPRIPPPPPRTPPPPTPHKQYMTYLGRMYAAFSSEWRERLKLWIRAARDGKWTEQEAHNKWAAPLPADRPEIKSWRVSNDRLYFLFEQDDVTDTLGLDRYGTVHARPSYTFPHGRTFAALEEAVNVCLTEQRATAQKHRRLVENVEQLKDVQENLLAEAAKFRNTSRWSEWVDKNEYPTFADTRRVQPRSCSSPWPETIWSPFTFTWRLIVKPDVAYLIPATHARKGWHELFVEVPRVHADLGGPIVTMNGRDLDGTYFQGSFWFKVPPSDSRHLITVSNLFAGKQVAVTLGTEKVFDGSYGGPVRWWGSLHDPHLLSYRSPLSASDPVTFDMGPLGAL